jgi:capsule polysaccharide export protein KpsE/RkpR
MELLQSRTVLDHQIDNSDLMRVYWTKRRYKARKKLVSRTDLKEDRKSGVIDITVTDTDPKRAQALANGYVNELNQLLANVSTSSARRERMFIEQRLESAKSDLEKAEWEFGRFAAKNSTFDLKEQSRAIVGAGAQLEGQVIAAQAELEGLQQTYTDENVRVRSVKARIGALKRELAKIGGTGDEGDMSLAPGDLSPPVRNLPLIGVQWADLYRRSKVQETVFELLTQQYEIAKIEEAKEIPTVKVVDQADYPERRAWPPRGLIVALGTLLALVGTIAWFKIKAGWNVLPADNPRKLRTLKFVRLFRNNHSQAA